MYFFLFNRTTLQVFVTYLTGALYVHTFWLCKHQHDNRVRSKLFVACQRWWFQWRFWFVPSVPGYLREEEEHKPGAWRNPTERNTYYLKCIVYDKLLKPRQSFLITLYFCLCYRNCQLHWEVVLISIIYRPYTGCRRGWGECTRRWQNVP